MSLMEKYIANFFYNANVMKEGIFSKWRESGLANKYTVLN